MKTKKDHASHRRQVSVRGTTFNALEVEADRRGMSVAKLVEKILAPPLEPSRDARR